MTNDNDISSMREEPYLKANLEIVEARSLVGKDMSGSSDPFCTCYLTTNPISRFNTSYKVSQLLRWGLNLTGCYMCSQTWDRLTWIIRAPPARMLGPFCSSLMPKYNGGKAQI